MTSACRSPVRLASRLLGPPAGHRDNAALNASAGLRIMGSYGTSLSGVRQATSPRSAARGVHLVPQRRVERRSGVCGPCRAWPARPACFSPRRRPARRAPPRHPRRWPTHERRNDSALSASKSLRVTHRYGTDVPGQSTTESVISVSASSDNGSLSALRRDGPWSSARLRREQSDDKRSDRPGR